jgi:hypothetical protein
MRLCGALDPHMRQRAYRLKAVRHALTIHGVGFMDKVGE